jgi:ketosteroid isomerase-like protein
MNIIDITCAPKLTTLSSSAAVALLGVAAFLSVAAAPAVAQTDSSTLTELDAFWAEVSRTVAEGDFAAYSATYHPDGVLVSGDRTSPIAAALDNWEPGFAETREGTSQPRVDFRFTRRAHDPTSAHEIGIFRFTSQVSGGEPSVQYVHFEALMVKRAGGWLMLMEYQKGPATQAEWDAAE